MKQVLFLDGVCPYVYDFKYLKTNPSGASESYLNMLARALYLKGKCEVYIFQHNRKKPDLQHGVKYIDIIIKLTKWKMQLVYLVDFSVLLEKIL